MRSKPNSTAAAQGPAARGASQELQLAQAELPLLLGYRLRRAQQRVFRDFATSVPGLSPGRVGILVLIESNPGITQSRLAREVSLDRSTLVGVLDRLEAGGLLERRRGEDRRTNLLRLTRAGRARLASARRAIGTHEARVAAVLTADERETLLALLAKLAP